MRLISAAEVSALLPVADAVNLMREAFVAISSQRASLAHRQALALPAGTGLLMGAALENHGIAAKLVAIMPRNRDRGRPGSIGLVALLDDVTGEPLALLDGTRLTAVRTAALNACAIDLLANEVIRIALLVGCGTQAAAQLAAMDAVRELEEIRVLGRDAVAAEEFVDRHRGQVSASICAIGDPVEALRDVGLVIAATDSPDPVIPGDRIPAGCHVSGIGSFRPDMREFDGHLLGRASIFVESRDTAAAEAGELIAAQTAGITAPDQWAEIGEVLAGKRPGRRDPQQITFFKSVGHAVFDLYAASAIYRAAERQGAGRTWQP